MEVEAETVKENKKNKFHSFTNDLFKSFNFFWYIYIYIKDKQRKHHNGSKSTGENNIL